VLAGKSCANAFELGDADKLVKSLIATASEPMNK
jgi:hypothetical protein